MILRKLVTDKIEEIGVVAAAEYFHVSVGTVSNWATNKTNPSLSAVELVMADMPKPMPQVAPEPEVLTMWEGRKVAILSPVYRTMNPATHWTLMANYARYGPEKIALIPPITGTVIHEARNRCIDKAMKTDAEDFIMPDDDMIFPFGESAYFNAKWAGTAKKPIPAAYNSISKIMSHPKGIGIVGALYFGRHPKGRAQCESGMRSAAASDAYRNGEHKGLVKEGWVGTGFIRIERWVIEKMKAHVDAGNWPEIKPVIDTNWYGYFNPLRVGVGEDVSFGRRASELGIQSYVDASLVALHAGEAYYGPHNTSG